MTDAETFAQQPSVVAAPDSEGRGVLLSVADGVYFSLNLTGWDVWQQLERPHTLADLAEGFADRHEVSRDRAEADVRALLDELVGRGLVVREGPA